MRLLAARLLADQVERMGRADARLERLLAAGLRAACVRRPETASGGRRGPDTGMQALWHRPDDLAGALGLESGEVRDLIRLDRALARLPRIAAAYDDGTLSRAKLLAILPRVQPESQDLWLARAARHEAVVLGEMGAAPAHPSAPGVLVPRLAATGDEFPIWMDATAAVREALRPLGPGTEPTSLIEGRIDEPRKVPDQGDATLFDAHDAHHVARDLSRLRRLVALRQSIEWRLARLLATVRRHALHRDLGCASLEAWAASVPGLAAPRLGALLALDRALASLPATADAWRRGRITWKQARLVARAATSGSEREWLRRALHVAPERLEALVGIARSAVTGSPRVRHASAQPRSGERGMTIGAPLAGSRRISTSVS